MMMRTAMIVVVVENSYYLARELQPFRLTGFEGRSWRNPWLRRGRRGEEYRTEEKGNSWRDQEVGQAEGTRQLPTLILLKQRLKQSPHTQRLMLD